MSLKFCIHVLIYITRLIFYTINIECAFYIVNYFSAAEFEIVLTPPFAESITEGDVRWEKGMTTNC